MKIDLRGVLSDLRQVRTVWTGLRVAREAGLRADVRLAVMVPAADVDPWADVMPSRAVQLPPRWSEVVADDAAWATGPTPVLAPQFHPVSEIDAERISRGGFNPYTEPEWQAAARPLTPINEGN